MKKLIVFNWKMNPPSPREAEALFQEVKIYASAARAHAEVVICPPSIYIQSLFSRISRLSPLLCGAQNVFWENKGAYTGEVSPQMLKRVGVRYALVGHSERRAVLHETDAMIARKVRAGLHAGLRVVLCVGEPLGVRRRGAQEGERFVAQQLARALEKGSASKAQTRKNLLVAYEPVWAIGAGRTATPEDAARMSRHIAQYLKKTQGLSGVRVLYGGSVSGGNAENFLHYKEIDGVLVGGASMHAKEVQQIIHSL